MSKLTQKVKKVFKHYLWHKRKSVSGEDCRKFAIKICIVPCEYVVRKADLPIKHKGYKWVGGQWTGNKFYGVPNDEKAFLFYDKNGPQIGDSQFTGCFKWTGGCIWKDKMYCFPRSRNSFLVYDLKTEEEYERFLPCGYLDEHHYGGVRTGEGIVYQPPRNTDHILVTDLKYFAVRKIFLAPSWMRMKFRYCGSIIHPNGYIYFLPERDQKVIKFNPVDETWCYIGKEISPFVFDAKVGCDGNIYGYSAYSDGILKIDVFADEVSMLHTEVKPEAYGTKMGINGKLYSVPGAGGEIYEYDIESDILRSIYHVPEDVEVKFAGGATNVDGRIIFAPAECSSVLILEPEVRGYEIPFEDYERIYVDFY